MKLTLNATQDRIVRRSVLGIGLAGVLLFGWLLVFSWLYPTVLEQWARKAIAHEVQQRVETHLDSLSNSALGEAAGRILKRNEGGLAPGAEPGAKAGRVVRMMLGGMRCAFPPYGSRRV
jgi:hypothetical protein